MPMGLGMGMGLSRPVVSAGSSSHASWPFTGLNNEASWAGLGGAWIWDAGTVSGGGSTDTDIASLTGAALTTFAAAVSLNTAILLSIHVVPDPFSATAAAVRVHGGSWVALNVSAAGWSTPVAVTTGAVAGFEVRGVSGGCDMAFDDVVINLA